MLKNFLIGVFFLIYTVFNLFVYSAFAQQYINPFEAKKLIEEKGAVIVDTMSYIECMDHRIPGSLCIALEEFEIKASKILKDKRQLIIFYCESDECLRAEETYSIAKKMGYENLYIIGGGLPAWKRAGFEVESIKRIKRQPVVSIKYNKLGEFRENKKDLFILDVRSEKLYMKEHINGAINIPLYTLHNRLKDIPRNRPILVVDENGKRSFLVCCYLINNGIKDVTRLFGGLRGIEKGKRKK